MACIGAAWGRIQITTSSGGWVGLEREWARSAYRRSVASQGRVRATASLPFGDTATPVKAELVECEVNMDEHLVSSSCAARARRHLVGLYVCAGAQTGSSLHVGRHDTSLWLPCAAARINIDVAPLRVTVIVSEPAGCIVRVTSSTRVIMRTSVSSKETAWGARTLGDERIAELVPAWR